MKITVILCTYNRCQSLANTLEDVVASRVENPIEWEVLVVDNNSTDSTREVVKDFSRRYPGRLRYLFEPQQGKSYALNTGVREARGDVLAFVDDDVAVEPTWLQNLTAPLNSEKWAGTGGRTLLPGAFSAPEWMTMDGPDNQGDVLAALFDLGPEPCELNRPPYGANMAFRREVFERHGLFRTDLGPQPGNEIRSEDTEFGRRLMAAGEKLGYEPSAVAYHPVHANRMHKSFFLKWHFDFGRAMVREWKSRPDIFGISRRCFTFFRFAVILLPRAVMRWMVAVNPRRRFFHKCWVWATAGQITEIRSQWQNTRKGDGSRQAEAVVPRLGGFLAPPRSTGDKTFSNSEMPRQQQL
jgi:glycosyltransferase involved in cell wall biosynthesis